MPSIKRLFGLVDSSNDNEEEQIERFNGLLLYKAGNSFFLNNGTSEADIIDNI